MGFHLFMAYFWLNPLSERLKPRPISGGLRSRPVSMLDPDLNSGSATIIRPGRFHASLTQNWLVDSLTMFLFLL